MVEGHSARLDLGELLAAVEDAPPWLRSTSSAIA